MNAAELNAWMDSHFTRSAFRLETLQTYEVASDGSDYRRYLDGEPNWTPERKQPWLDHLAAERAQGLFRHRVRVVTHPVSAYTRYECEWGYVPNVDAGETIRILEIDRWPADDHHIGADDFWLVTDASGARWATVMHYGPDGRFHGGVEVTDQARLDGLVDRRHDVWEQAEPFTSWWERHPELHRDSAKVE